MTARLGASQVANMVFVMEGDPNSIKRGLAEVDGKVTGMGLNQDVARRRLVYLTKEFPFNQSTKRAVAWLPDPDVNAPGTILSGKWNTTKIEANRVGDYTIKVFIADKVGTGVQTIKITE